MEVVALTPIRHDKGRHSYGDIFEVSDEQGIQLIADGKAEAGEVFAARQAGDAEIKKVQAIATKKIAAIRDKKATPEKEGK